MDSDETELCMSEKDVDESTKHKEPWFYIQDDSKLVSAAVKLTLSLVVSSTVSSIAFMLKSNRRYDTDIMCNFYVAVLLLWMALMSLIFFNFMWRTVLKGKEENIKACFVFGMGVNMLFVFSTAIHACTDYDGAVTLFVVLFIGVFNSMAMLMFHETKVQKEEEKRQRIYEYMRPTFEIPKGVEVSVEKEPGK